MLDLESGRVRDHAPFEVGNAVMCTGGKNRGRVGTVQHRERHKVRAFFFILFCLLSFCFLDGGPS